MRIKKTISLLLATFLLGFLAQAQIFTLNGGYQSFPAQSGGTPGLPNGTVLVRKAPAPTGNISLIQQKLNQATIPDAVINSRLTQGPLAGYIAQMPAMTQVADALNARPATKSTAGAIVINSNASLSNNLGNLANNAAQTYVFRGNVSTNNPIVIGSNKTIWIDGNLTYSGPVITLSSGDEFSPLGFIPDGIFRMINKSNIKVFGTKRGLVDCKARIPFVYTFESSNITVNDLEVINGYNTLFFRGSSNITVENNFLYNNVRRAIHLLAVNTSSTKRNLMFDNFLDGIDVDAFTTKATVQFNVMVGARFRLMLWTEVAANNNVLDNNVGIHMDRQRGPFVGGFEENGNEQVRPQPNFNNEWKHNNIFYPKWSRDGMFMFKERKINHNTITFNNNYVWSVEGNIMRHNPKQQTNITNDVRFLTVQNPAPGTRPRPAGFPQGVDVVANNTPGPLPFSAIQVTPGLFGGGGNTGGNNGGGNNGGNNGNDTGGAPIGKTIWLRKSGGDRKFVTTTNNDSQLAASADDSNAAAQQFVVESHPSGGVALKSVSSNQYIQVFNTDQNIAIKAKGASKLAWERFTWKSKGTNQVALRSVQSGRWIQAAHNQNNAVLFPRGASDLTWETFDWGEVNATGGNTGGDSGGNTGGNNGGNTGGGDTFFIVNRQTGKKLAPQNSNDGAQLIQLDASNNSNIAKWEQVDTSNGFFYLRNVSTGKYFRPATDADGSILEQRPTSFSGSFTQWEKVNTSGGYFYLKNRQTQLYFRPNLDGNNSTMVQRPTTFSGFYTQWTFQNASAKSLNNSASSVSIYPNPASDVVNINADSNSLTSVIIYNAAGAEVSNSGSDSSIDISSLEAGVYFLRISVDGSIVTKTLVKE